MRLPKVFLASKSPRRKQLLEDCRIAYELVEAEIDESMYPADLPVTDIAAYLAQQKADKALSQLHDGLVLAADSVVICEGELMGKPVDRADAFRMLEALSGRKHQVITGVCIQDHKKKVVFSDTSHVTFAELDEEEIAFYVDAFEPYDKAGGYAIQEWIGDCKIVRLEGSYTNIMGLPTERVYRTLKTWVVIDG